jgi:hypothetical protein
LGLDGNKIYQLFRDPVELERAAPTFERLPILKKHVESPATADAMPNDLVIGTIGSDVKFNAPYLDADLCFWDSTAIACIETDTVRELSCGYRYTAAMEPGEFEGQPYDGRITEIVGNHLALVEAGRAGSDVIVADHNPFITEANEMKSSKLGKALMLALCAMSPTLLANDSAWSPLVAQANRKTFKKDDVKAKLMGIDAALDPAKIDSVIDAILDVEQDPMPKEPMVGAVDESPAEKLRKMLEGKVDDATMEACLALIPAAAAVDADPDCDMVKKEDVVAATDALRKEMREANEAAREVRPVVGDVIGIDSAEGIYKFALEHMKVDHSDVAGVPSLKALFKVAHSASKNAAAVPVIGADSATVVKQFPMADRFSQA